jgi:hypothetical protein
MMPVPTGHTPCPVTLIPFSKCMASNIWNHANHITYRLATPQNSFPSFISYPLAYEDGTDTVFRNVGY